MPASEKSLLQFIDGWRVFVNRVGTGYPGSLHDYVNELSIRDILDEFLTEPNNRIPPEMREHLNNLDAEYQQFTYPVRQPIKKNRPALSERWYRVPKLVRGTFEKDLIREGVLPSD